MNKPQSANLLFYPYTRLWGVLYLICLLLTRAEWFPALIGFYIILVLGIPLTLLVAVEWSRVLPGRKIALWFVLMGTAWWIATALLVRAEFEWHIWYTLNTITLLLVAYTIGLWLAGEIERVGHLLPVCILGTLVDIWSVFQGPSKHVGRQVVEHVERQIETGVWQPPPFVEFLILHWPQPGGSFMSPLFGFGDLVFIALFLGGSNRFAISITKTFWLLIAGLAVALIVCLFLDRPIPALPFLCGFFILGNYRNLSLTRNEWKLTLWISIAIIVVGLLTYYKSIIVGG